MCGAGRRVYSTRRASAAIAGVSIELDRWTDCVRRCRPYLAEDDGACVSRALIEMVTLLIVGSPRLVDQRELELVRSSLLAGLKDARA